MDKKWRKVALLAMSVFMASAVVGGLAGCGKGDNSDSTIPDANLKKGTYRTYTPVMPSITTLRFCNILRVPFSSMIMRSTKRKAESSSRTEESTPTQSFPADSA